MSDDHQTYSLHHTFASRWITLGSAIWPLLAALFVLLPLAFGDAPIGVLLLLPVFLVMGSFGAYWSLRIPSTIEWHGDGTISFKSPLRTVLVRASEIESIRPWRSGLGFLELRYSGKRLTLLNQFDGFHDFISRLRQSAPAIQIHGC